MNTATHPIARALTATTLLVALAGLTVQVSGCSSTRPADALATPAKTEAVVVVTPQVTVTATVRPSPTMPCCR